MSAERHLEYTLKHGVHKTRADGMCLMEAVAFLAGEEHSDAPACACPVLTDFAVGINDAMGEGRFGDAYRAKYLHDLAPLLVGSRADGLRQVRGQVLADHAQRVFAPLARAAAAPSVGGRFASYAADNAEWCAGLAVMEAAAGRPTTAAGCAAEAAALTARLWDPDVVWEAARVALLAALEVEP